MLQTHIRCVRQGILSEIGDQAVSWPRGQLARFGRRHRAGRLRAPLDAFDRDGDLAGIQLPQLDVEACSRERLIEQVIVTAAAGLDKRYRMVLSVAE